mmetsp:Transcript_1376/g.3074  ORF Transcript_1376/g.3074 Transcript_1376/m.3074 type:complete len:338 (-) Transcript_1376:8-1021(-)
MAGPEQACMASSFKDGQGGHVELTARWEARHREVQEVLDSLEKGDVAEESTAGRVVLGVAGQVANALYLLLSLAHLSLIYVQSVSTATDGSLFLLLSGLQVVLAFEATVYAAGGFSISKAALEMAGRIRLLLGATAWAWLLPWAAELNCRCNAEPQNLAHPASSTALLALQQGYTLAFFVSGFFALREICVILRGEPPSALDRSQRPRFGDCLPSNAVLGGQFRLDKAELEASGRAIFIPSRPRAGLDLSSGLALVSHLFGAFVLRGRGMTGPWMLGGCGALAARRLGSVWDAACSGSEVPRLLCRSGELWWLLCALWQLQECEAYAGGVLPQCLGE